MFTGLIETTGRVAKVASSPGGTRLEIATGIAGELRPGDSIATNGVSLTVASLSDRRAGVQIVPFTRAHTSLQHAAVGDLVNVEVDVLGKYVMRLMELRGVATA